MHGNIQHQHLRKRIHQKHEPYPHPHKFKRVFDKVIYVIAIVTPLANLPQVFKVWVHQDVGGISSLSWISFVIISAFWVVYGVLHREKPIIITNSLLIIVQSLIVVGVLIYG